jgi:hypothetical protein
VILEILGFCGFLDYFGIFWNDIVDKYEVLGIPCLFIIPCFGKAGFPLSIREQVFRSRFVKPDSQSLNLREFPVQFDPSTEKPVRVPIRYKQLSPGVPSWFLLPMGIVN